MHGWQRRKGLARTVYRPAPGSPADRCTAPRPGSLHTTCGLKLSLSSLAVLPQPFDEAVLDVVAQVPARHAVSFSDVSRAVGGGPRRVARTMSRFGDGVAWWRVVRVDGSPAPEVAVEARRRWAEEAMPVTNDGSRVDWPRVAWRIPPLMSEPGGTPKE